MDKLGIVYASRDSKTYHEAWCPYAKRLKHKELIQEEKARERGQCECKFCRSARGIVYRYRYLLLGEIECLYDKVDDAICFKTDAGFWKLVWMEDQAWHLFHLNHGCFWKERPADQMMRRKFHRQVDVLPSTSVAKIVNYIREHDKNLVRTDGDYRKMPRSTKKQQKYYNRAKKRAKKKSVRNVYKILDEINQNGSQKGELING